jgi:hypothetical protein
MKKTIALALLIIIHSFTFPMDKDISGHNIEMMDAWINAMLAKPLSEILEKFERLSSFSANQCDANPILVNTEKKSPTSFKTDDTIVTKHPDWFTHGKTKKKDNFKQKCPICGKISISKMSLAGAQSALQRHLKKTHKNVNPTEKKI